MNNWLFHTKENEGAFYPQLILTTPKSKRLPPHPQPTVVNINWILVANEIVEAFTNRNVCTKFEKIQSKVATSRVQMGLSDIKYRCLNNH